ncbi:MAG TPA: glycoside hydrolase family 3 C-terminal domain-containing protein, partial [Arachidicoccus soli]|nr:glycoside hydrolase family 3 C-terminal domain-containing protein [Arachidicoccus soli]
ISAKTSESHVQKLLWAMPDKDMHQRAIDLALSSDVIVLGMGLSPQLEGEEMPVLVEGFNKGDRSSLDLPQSQTKFIKDIVRLGKPVVLVLFNGCALSINWEKDNVPAIIEAWYGGQSAGSAVADVLFGDFNPSGKLPITFYKSVEQLPAFDDYSMKNRTYRFFKEEVLFGFGFGLSYSKFLFSDLDVVSVNNKHNFIVSVKVKNGSSITGTVVVQLYVSRVNPSDRYPLKSLQKFKKIILKPSEEVKVEFLLSSINFSIIDEDANRTVEKGQFKIFVGESQPNTKEENSKILSTIVNVAV